MGGKSLFTVEAVCEILDTNVPDDVLAEKYNTTVKTIRDKRYHLANRNKIRTSTEFKDFVAKNSHAARQYCQEKKDNNIIESIKKSKSVPLLKIMDKILDDFASFEAEYKKETIRNNEVALLEKLLDKNVVLLSRLIQRDLAFFTAVSEKGAKEAQDDYLAKLGFSNSDIGFYRAHRLDFEVQEGNDNEV